VPLPQRPRRQPQRWRDAATHADQAPTSSGQVHVHDRFVQRVDAVPAVDVPSPLQRLERRPYPRVDHPRASQPIFQRGGAEGTRGIVQLAPPGRRAARRAEGPSRPRFRLLVGRVDRPQVGPLPLVQGRPRVHRAHPPPPRSGRRPAARLVEQGRWVAVCRALDVLLEIVGGDAAFQRLYVRLHADLP
jgi:hypothetical protein